MYHKAHRNGHRRRCPRRPRRTCESVRFVKGHSRESPQPETKNPFPRPKAPPSAPLRVFRMCWRPQARRNAVRSDGTTIIPIFLLPSSPAPPRFPRTRGTRRQCDPSPRGGRRTKGVQPPSNRFECSFLRRRTVRGRSASRPKVFGGQRLLLFPHAPHSRCCFSSFVCVVRV
jgi:hypothetical protein